MRQIHHIVCRFACVACLWRSWVRRASWVFEMETKGWFSETGFTGFFGWESAHINCLVNDVLPHNWSFIWINITGQVSWHLQISSQFKLSLLLLLRFTVSFPQWQTSGFPWSGRWFFRESGWQEIIDTVTVTVPPQIRVVRFCLFSPLLNNCTFACGFPGILHLYTRTTPQHRVLSLLYFCICQFPLVIIWSFGDPVL
jgi:hypothetical protein